MRGRRLQVAGMDSVIRRKREDTCATKRRRMPYVAKISYSKRS